MTDKLREYNVAGPAPAGTDGIGETRRHYTGMPPAMDSGPLRTSRRAPNRLSNENCCQKHRRWRWLHLCLFTDACDRTETRHAWLPLATTKPDYDPDGNLTDDGLWTYIWDAESRLISMETTITAVTAGRPFRKLAFHYDWTGRRLARTITDTNNAVLSAARWLYDAWNPVAEYFLHTSSLILHTSYLWGIDISGTLQGAGGVGGLLAVGQFDIQNSTFVISHPSFDGNGNITAWTQSGTTTPVCRREYDAFGNIVVEQGAAPCAIGFSTKIEDPETGLLYYAYRYYQPPTGRWLSEDPIEEEGGVNLYGFAGNAGVDYVDYLGMDALRTKVSAEYGPKTADPDFPLPVLVLCTEDCDTTGVPARNEVQGVARMFYRLPGDASQAQSYLGRKLRKGETLYYWVPAADKASGLRGIASELGRLSDGPRLEALKAKAISKLNGTYADLLKESGLKDLPCHVIAPDQAYTSVENAFIVNVTYPGDPSQRPPVAPRLPNPVPKPPPPERPDFGHDDVPAPKTQPFEMDDDYDF